jgi:predicted CXXCH cytochrome family protein
MIRRSSHNQLNTSKRNLSFLFIGILAIYLSGCSSAKNYKVLSFFFDGVPLPVLANSDMPSDSLSRTDSTAILQAPVAAAAPQTYFHPPYQEKDCASCHDQVNKGQLTSPQPGLCYQCHEDFNTKYKVLHGPVGGGQCTACHNPHMSGNEHLLTRTSQALCLYCHQQEQVAKVESHHDIGDTNCTDCHNPHGGEDKYSLR